MSSSPDAPTPQPGPYDPPDEAAVSQIRAASRSMLFGGLWPALVVGLGATVVAGFLAGVSGVLSAVLGLVLVIGVCALGPLVMGWTARSAPLVVMGVAMVSFVGKLGVLFVLFLVAQGLELTDTRIAALVLGATALAFIVGESVAFARSQATTIAV